MADGMNPDDARWAMLALYAEDMYGDPLNLAPAADPRLAADGWQLVQRITAVDALVRPKRFTSLFDPQRVYYGYVAQSTSAPNQYAVVIRGTQGFVEWIEDLEGEPVHCALGGKVHAGFWDVYASMQVGALPIIQVLLPLLTDCERVTVVGHSLGAALATYLADALSLHLGSARVSARLFASPRTGNVDFMTALAAAVPDHLAYAYDRDLVPRVPFGFGYLPVPNLATLQAGSVQAVIEDNPLCNHHVLCYGGMLNRALLTPARLASIDARYLGCLPDLTWPTVAVPV